MRKNYKIIISYDGTRYYGWEHQPNQVTIQGKIEDVLLHLGDKPIEVIGAGRTDAGVHAEGMTAHFVLDTEKTPEELRDYMNHYLPDDIVIKEIREASDRFHARYNAIGKTYRYLCFDGKTKPIFDRKYVWTLEQRLDIDKMQEAAKYLIGEHDFCSFCKNPQKKKSTVRVIDRIEIQRLSSEMLNSSPSGDYISLTFHGNGFLRNMVRILTGTLVGVGLGEISPNQVKEILEAKNRKMAGVTAPAKGLCLMQVDYM